MIPTCFSQLIGNDEIKRQLERMIAKRAMGHALLFAGPDGVGKSLFATALAASIMKAYDPEADHSRKIASGHHPDLHFYRPEGKLGLHSIQSMRQLSDEVYLPPYEASWKVFIIHDADRMLSYSANALLKTFEEPPARTLIILISRSAQSLLPTIISRCSTLHFKLLSDKEITDFLKEKYPSDDMTHHKIVRQAQGSLGQAIKLALHGDPGRTALLNVFLQGLFPDYRSLQKGVELISEQVEIARKQVEESAKEELNKMSFAQLSPQQQHALEKEMEGLTALALTREAHITFDTIISWYRDLQVLLLGGEVHDLSNPDLKNQLEQAVQRGEFKPLDQVYRAVEEAYLSLQRSTPLALCLENLFLKLDRI
ncbi:MAG: ATP-binding protein [Parachlamydiaceae bacterium]